MVKGGARLLELQGACPFRAAVELRLGGVELEHPEAGIAATERGKLAHAVLQAVLATRCATQSALLAHDADERVAHVVRAHVQAVLAPLRATADEVGARLLRSRSSAGSKQRVLELLQHDAERAPFTVELVEDARVVDVGGVQTRIVLDRVDRLADGSFAVIDYKTGAERQARRVDGRATRAAATAAVRASDRPGSGRAPSPSASSARAAPSTAASRATVRSSRSSRRSMPTKAPFKDYASWGDLLQAWHRRLESIAREHAQGDARLAPNPTRACRYCHLPGVCRSAQARSMPEGTTMQPADLLQADRQARAAALQVDRSFIVQAPAGSGKTELLTQRFLALLAVVDRPEALLAITFTRKAAAEMRNRILESLRQCEDPASKLRDETRALAQRVLAVDARNDWGLLRNPSRLRVLTIDALNQSLARRLPVLSGLGAGLGIDEDGVELYEEAAERLLAHLPSDEPRVADAVAILLEHLDNNVGRLVGLIGGMLARREAWLPVLPGERRARRPRGCGPRSRSRTRARTSCADTWPRCARRSRRRCSHDACRHAGAAAQVLRAAGKESPILECASGRPGTELGRRAVLAGTRGVPADWQGRAAQELHRSRRRAAAGRQASRTRRAQGARARHGRRVRAAR